MLVVILEIQCSVSIYLHLELPKSREPLNFTVPLPVQIIQGEREEVGLPQVKNYLRDKGSIKPAM